MVNGDPITYFYFVQLQFHDRKTGMKWTQQTQIGASNYEEAKQNAVNCYKRWYPEYEITAV